MARTNVSIKRVAISKANTQVVIIAASAGFISVLCLVMAHAYISQNGYLGKVIAKKELASKQLQANIVAASKLNASYDAFQSQPSNVIGGNAAGSGPNDGKNSTIVLDALPSTYDFPALTSSLEKLLTDRKLKVDSISGVDDEIAQAATTSSPNPVAVPMSFSFKISQASYTNVQDAVKALNLSIRPIQVDSLTMSGANASMALEVSAHTYYQPPKNLSIKSEVVQP